jgi:hypothetical protein
VSSIAQVFGQRHPWVQRLLAYEDEVFAAVSFLLDRHSLLTLDATFAESLYGLKRQRFASLPPPGPPQQPAPTPPSSQPQQQQQQQVQPGVLGLPPEQQLPGRLSQGARWAALLGEVSPSVAAVAGSAVYRRPPALHAPAAAAGGDVSLHVYADPT